MDDYRAANRQLWDRWADLHVGSDFYDVDAWRSGDDHLPAWLVSEVGDVTGKDLLHLQCHFGLDTLSWARRGARVTGVDFSPRAIAHARELATGTGIPARFVESDVFDLPGALDGDFDVVFASFGVLFWLSDLARWAQVVARFVRPGGFAYLADDHPIARVLDDDHDVTEPRLRSQYFPSDEPVEFEAGWGSYAAADPERPEQTGYGWAHSLGEVVTAFSGAGLTVEFLHEFPFMVWRRVPYMVQAEPRAWRLPPGLDGCLPMTFSIRATKAPER